jgi:hypothetical protein
LAGGVAINIGHGQGLAINNVLAMANISKTAEMNA